jgi:hypothetical protein
MQYRRIREEQSGGTWASLLLGAGLGLAAGFLLGELYAGEGRRAMTRVLLPWRRPGKAKPNPSDLTDDLQLALEKVLGPDAQSLDLVPVGSNAIELHGWVTSRMSRSRAIRITREALNPSIKLVDRLLVWGEDDAPLPEPKPEPEPDSPRRRATEPA